MVDAFFVVGKIIRFLNGISYQLLSDLLFFFVPLFEERKWP